MTQPGSNVRTTLLEGGITVSERRYDIDWVRVLATLAVFVLHRGRFFDTIDWHLKNGQQSAMLTMFQGWSEQHAPVAKQVFQSPCGKERIP